MKKLVVGFLVTFGIFTGKVFADTQDPFTFLEGNAVLAITQHGSVTYEYGERGTRNISLLDNVVEALKIQNSYLFGIDAGLNGASAPQTGETSIGWTAGAKLNISAITNGAFHVAPEWEFIRSLSYGVRYAYDSTIHHPRWTITAGYSFGPGSPR